MCAWDALLAHASGCIRFNELDETVVRRTLEGIIGSISVHPEDVKEVAVAVMLYMMDSRLVRKRLAGLTDWEKPLVFELLELARLEHTRRYGMALLVTFLGYDDFRHQVCVCVCVCVCSLTRCLETRHLCVRAQGSH